MKLRNILAMLALAVLLSACNTAAATEPIATEAVVTEAATEEVTEEPETEAVTEEVTEEQTEAAVEVKAADFWGMETPYTREFSGENIAGSTHSVDYTDGDRAQLRVVKEDEPWLYVYEKRADEIAVIAGGKEQYFRHNLLNGIDDPNQNTQKAERVLLKDPIQVGESWTTDADPNEVKVTIKEVLPKTADHDARVVVEIVDVLTGNSPTLQTYEVGKGLVAEETAFATGSEPHVMAVTGHDVERKATTVRLYYPSNDGEGFVRREISHVFEPNSITRFVLEELWKQVPDAGIAALTENTKINYLYSNADETAYIDLSRDFIDEMNSGSTGETMMLDSIAYTVGDLMSAKRVVLTIDGVPYSGAHVEMQDGDAMSTAYKESDIVNVINE